MYFLFPADGVMPKHQEEVVTARNSFEYNHWRCLALVFLLQRARRNKSAADTANKLCEV